MNVQIVAVSVLVAFSALYIIRRLWREWRRAQSGCSSCTVAKIRKPDES